MQFIRSLAFPWVHFFPTVLLNIILNLYGLSSSNCKKYGCHSSRYCLYIALWLVCWLPPRPIQVLWFAGSTHRSQHSRFIITRRYKAKSTKGKRQQKKPTGNQEQISKSPLPVESYRTCLITSAMSCYNMYKTSLRGLNAHGFYWGLITCVAQTNVHQNSTLPTLCTQFRYSRTLLWVLGMMGTLLKSKFPDCSQRLLSHQGSYVNPFLHN